MCGRVLVASDVATVKSSRELADMLSHNNDIGYCAAKELKKKGVAVPQVYLDRIGADRSTFAGRNAKKKH